MGDTFLLLLLFAVAFLGHFALMIASHNYLYGQKLPDGVSKIVHLSFAAAILAGPLTLYGLTGHVDVRPGLRNWEFPGAILAGYLVLCLFMGGIVVPIITLRRWLRKEPAVQLDCESRVVDVAADLGFKPLGIGPVGFLPHLPGNEIFTLELVRRTLRLPRLPVGLDGLKILHLTDMHISGTPDKDWWRRVIDLCQEWEPDIVCLTGDVVETDEHQGWLMPTLGWLRPRHGAFAILGNHDQWIDHERTRQALEQVGFQVLQGRWLQVEVNGIPLVVVGHEGPWFGPTPNLSESPSGVFRLGLSHTPDNYPWAREQQIDLLLAGHVHGGQIRFPIIGSLLVPSKYGRRYDCGLFHEGPTVMYVGRGLAGDHAVRYGCRPEATLLVLRAPEVQP